MGLVGQKVLELECGKELPELEHECGASRRGHIHDYFFHELLEFRVRHVQEEPPAEFLDAVKKAVLDLQLDHVEQAKRHKAAHQLDHQWSPAPQGPEFQQGLAEYLDLLEVLEGGQNLPLDPADELLEVGHQLPQSVALPVLPHQPVKKPPDALHKKPV